MKSLMVAGNLPGATAVLMNVLNTELVSGDGWLSIDSLMRVAHVCDQTLHGSDHSVVVISMR